METSKQFTLEYFIDFYSKIPDEKWCTGFLYLPNYKKASHQCCALGHLGLRQHIQINNNDRAKALQSFFNTDPSGRPSAVPVIQINDDVCNFYIEGSTPKQRIINALKSLLNK